MNIIQEYLDAYRGVAALKEASSQAKRQARRTGLGPKQRRAAAEVAKGTKKGQSPIAKKPKRSTYLGSRSKQALELEAAGKVDAQAQTNLKRLARSRADRAAAAKRNAEEAARLGNLKKVEDYLAKQKIAENELKVYDRALASSTPGKIMREEGSLKGIQRRATHAVKPRNIQIPKKVLKQHEAAGTVPRAIAKRETLARALRNESKALVKDRFRGGAHTQLPPSYIPGIGSSSSLPTDYFPPQKVSLASRVGQILKNNPKKSLAIGAAATATAAYGGHKYLQHRRNKAADLAAQQTQDAASDRNRTLLKAGAGGLAAGGAAYLLYRALNKR